jgi:O-antigen ligase
MRTLAYWLSLLFIFTIPWEAVVEDPVLGSATRLMGLALAGFWAATVVTTGRIRWPTPFHFIVFLLLIWNAVSIFWSANPDRTFEHLITWIQLTAMTFLLWDLFGTRKALLAGLQMYILGAYVVFANTVSNFAAGTTFYYERFSAPGTNPDDLGIVLALGIPVAWYLTSSKNTESPLFLQKWINYAYIPAAFLGIALSGTRTALIAVVPGMVFGLLSLTRLSIWARSAIIALFIAAAWIIAPLIPQASFQRLGTTGTELAQGDLNGRVELWTQGLASFAEHPIVGVGSNMFRSVNIEGKVAHNSFLSILVELGIVGLILFGIVLAIVLVQAARQSPWDSAFWFSVLAVWTIGAFTLTWEYRKPTWLFLCLVIVSAALSRYAHEDVQVVRSSPYRSAEHFTQ